jgi:diguanylate cyclase (GGDEF)-like protein
MPAKYSYKRIGMEAPQELVFHQGKATLDGYELSDEELARLLDNVKKERATLDKNLNSGMVDADMAKAELDLYQALGHMRNAVKAGALHPDALRTISSHVFKDTMVPSMGNKKAYEDFMSRPKKGVHVHIDLNDFGSINKQHGFDAGDEAIKSAGNAIRSAMDESVGKSHGKLFRRGGDEFSAFVPSHEHAARFIRTLKNHFNKIPPIQGTHTISSSIGVGENPQTAEHALIQAKTAKKAAAYPLGQAKDHAYSAVPGQEGHLPVE